MEGKQKRQTEIKLPENSSEHKTSLKTVTELLANRIQSRQQLLDSIIVPPLANLPESVVKMREEEAGRIRAVLLEQQEILALIKSIA